MKVSDFFFGNGIEILTENEKKAFRGGFNTALCKCYSWSDFHFVKQLILVGCSTPDEAVALCEDSCGEDNAYILTYTY